jgi:hypothetical protein
MTVDKHLKMLTPHASGCYAYAAESAVHAWLPWCSVMHIDLLMFIHLMGSLVAETNFSVRVGFRVCMQALLLLVHAQTQYVSL